MAEKGIHLVSGRPQAPEDDTKNLPDLMANLYYDLGSLFLLFTNSTNPGYQELYYQLIDFRIVVF